MGGRGSAFSLFVSFLSAAQMIELIELKEEKSPVRENLRGWAGASPIHPQFRARAGVSADLAAVPHWSWDLG